MLLALLSHSSSLDYSNGENYKSSGVCRRIIFLTAHAGVICRTTHRIGLHFISKNMCEEHRSCPFLITNIRLQSRVTSSDISRFFSFPRCPAFSHCPTHYHMLNVEVEGLVRRKRKSILSINFKSSMHMKALLSLVACRTTFCRHVQAYLGDIAGSVPDHRNEASYTNLLVSQWI
jgi:hypothetical protein